MRPASGQRKSGDLLDRIPNMDAAARTSVDPALMWIASTCLRHERLGL